MKNLAQPFACNLRERDLLRVRLTNAPSPKPSHRIQNAYAGDLVLESNFLKKLLDSMGLRKLGFTRTLLDPKPGGFLDSKTYVL